MTRPEPTDIVGTLAYLAEAIDDLRRVRDETRYGPTEAARKLGFNQAHFWGKPWRIPTFGLEYDREYTLPEYRAWLSRPEAERRAEWDLLPLKARRNAQGAA